MMTPASFLLWQFQLMIDDWLVFSCTVSAVVGGDSIEMTSTVRTVTLPVHAWCAQTTSQSFTRVQFTLSHVSIDHVSIVSVKFA